MFPSISGHSTANEMVSSRSKKRSPEDLLFSDQAHSHSRDGLFNPAAVDEEADQWLDFLSTLADGLSTNPDDIHMEVNALRDEWTKDGVSRSDLPPHEMIQPTVPLAKTDTATATVVTAPNVFGVADSTSHHYRKKSTQQKAHAYRGPQRHIKSAFMLYGRSDRAASTTSTHLGSSKPRVSSIHNDFVKSLFSDNAFDSTEDRDDHMYGNVQFPALRVPPLQEDGEKGHQSRRHETPHNSQHWFSSHAHHAQPQAANGPPYAPMTVERVRTKQRPLLEPQTLYEHQSVNESDEWKEFQAWLFA